MLKVNNEIGASYKKHYKMNVVGKGGATTTVAISPEVIDRKAEEVGLSPKEFIRCYKVVAHYDNFDGVFYAFKRVANGDE